MANPVPIKKLGRPRKNKKSAEFQKVDVREFFRAYPSLQGQQNVVLSLGGKAFSLQIVYHKHAPPKPLPSFVCPRCTGGARILFLVTPPGVGIRFAEEEMLHMTPVLALLCRSCAAVDADSHNLTGKQRSLRRTRKLRKQLAGGGLLVKPKGMHQTTHARLCRGIRREHQLRQEITGLRAAGLSRLGAELHAAVATGTSDVSALSDRELTRALRAVLRLKGRG